MLLKEIQRTANVAWSPAEVQPIMLAVGTAAQQLDASFSTSATLELFELNLGEAGLDMEPSTSLECDSRLSKLVWSSCGISDGKYSQGLLCGGLDNGKISVWDVSAISSQPGEALISTLDKHTGSVAALDANPFQANLLASGSSDSEIYIWDLSKPGNPMSPGAKSQPADFVTSVAWNMQVQHILANTFSSRCVVWDLRKSEPIIKISDSMSRMKCKQVCWHPEVATQLCLSSEDDHTPVAQVWDLRYATAPLRTFERHTRGITSMAWCVRDPDILLTCGKDSKLICWDPNSAVPHGEVLTEMPTRDPWCFDVQWCPRCPGVVSCCSFEGHVSVMSMTGGGAPPAPSKKATDSFVADAFGSAALPDVSLPEREVDSQQKVEPLKRPPRWLRKPAGVSFAFGGRLVTFENNKTGNPQQPYQSSVCISQVVTESEFVAQSAGLEASLQGQQFGEFCAMKAANSDDSLDQQTWSFLKAGFESQDRRSSYLKLLGFENDDLKDKVSTLTATEVKKDVDEVTSGVAELSTEQTVEDSAADDQGASGMFGGRGSGSAFDGLGATASGGGRADPDDMFSAEPLSIPTDNGVEGLLSQSILTGDFASAVDLCLHDNRLADAIILSIAGGQELLAKTQAEYFKRSNSSVTRLLAAVVGRSWGDVVSRCELANWKQALALCLTYASAEEFGPLCDVMGGRLEASTHPALAANAVLCYVCSGNLDALVRCWVSTPVSQLSPEQLQELVDKVMLARRNVEISLGRAHEVDSEGPVCAALTHYASLLASQGSLQASLGYLASTNAQQGPLAELYERVYQSLGYPANPNAPRAPFGRVDVRPETSRPAAASTAHPLTASRHPGPGPHQTQAGSTFGTVTSPSTSTAYTPYHQPTSAYHQPTPAYHQPTTSTSTPYYTPAPHAPVSHHHQPPAPPPTSSVGGSGAGAPHHVPSTGERKRYPSVGSDPYHEFTSTYPQPADPYAYNPASSTGTPTSMYNPTSTTSSGYGGQPPSAANNYPSTYQNNAPADRGWNDPPPVRNRQKKEALAPREAPAPITAPIFGVPSQPQQPPTYNGTGAAQPNNGSAVPPAGNPGAYYGGYGGGAGASLPPAPVAEQKPAPPPEPVVKGPLPAEYMPLQQKLDSLLEACQGRANTAMVKRKLDDVHKKLEAMYDRLRDDSLSSSVTQGLHHILAYLQQSDYPSSLAMHAQMVSQGNFSEISSFMPGLKVLLQVAQQMQVYVQ